MRSRSSRASHSHVLTANGRQASMHCVSAEFLALATSPNFLVVRCAPRMGTAEDGHPSA